jgi:hypothetical protein
MLARPGQHPPGKDPPVVDDSQCQACEQVLQLVLDSITSDTTQEEVKELLLAGANNLGSLGGQLATTFGDNIAEIYGLISSGADDPHLICAALGLCGQ